MPRTILFKILFPTAVAALATLLATVVSSTLSGRAAARLDAAEQRDFRALELSQEVLSELQTLHLRLLNYGSTGVDTNLVNAEGAVDKIHEKLEADGELVLGKQATAERRAALDAYVALAKKAANAAARRALDVERRPATAEEIERANQEDSQYDELAGVWQQDAERAKAAMTDAFADAKRRQRAAVRVGAGILFLAALGSLVFGAWISYRLSAPIRRLSELASSVADGDLRHAVVAESGDEVGILAESFRRMVARLRTLVSTLQSTSADLAAAAERLNQHTRAQSHMLEVQASGVAETSSTTRELEQTSAMAATRAASVLDVARRAAGMSETGRQATERSAQEMRRIQGSVEGIVGQSTAFLEQARQVSEVVATVRDLASQSHVLSLNASIEASRAGDAGRGFAVVAKEMRSLAEQSGRGAQRIDKLVANMLSALKATRELTERGSQGIAGSLEEIRTSGQTLGDIGGVVHETSDAALQIAAAVQQQSVGIGQISSAMRDIEKGMAESVDQIRTLESSARTVGETAARISGLASEFQV